MEIRDLLTRGVTLIIDPRTLKTSLDDFLASYGGYLEDIVGIAKDVSGRVFYPSRVAPADEEYPTFFSELIDTTSAVGLSAGAYVNVFADTFFASDQDFKTHTTSGDSLDSMVCPNKPNFHKHLLTVIKEVAEFPLETLFLGNLGYAHTNYCYCSDCRAEFTKFADLRHDFQVADQAANPALFDTWIEWRVSKVSEIVRQIFTTANDAKPELRVVPTFPIDPEGGYVSGARTRLGLDLDYIAEVAKNLAIEVFPWTPILPDPGSKEFSEYIENLAFITKLQRAGINVLMTHWIIEDEGEFNRAKAIAKAAGVEQIYTMLGYPPGYHTLREIRLGLMR